MKIGLDWGGTKLEVIALDPETNEELVRNRIDSPKDDYQEILDAVCGLISDTAGQTKDITVGIGMPGSLNPLTELVQVSNTKALEGKDVSNLVNFLISDESNMIRGQNIIIDGGRSLVI